MPLSLIETGPKALEADCRAGEAKRGLLVTEVDFKWLMAGQGWWVNTQRFRSDSGYAARMLVLALASSCTALRECAAALREQRAGQRV